MIRKIIGNLLVCLLIPIMALARWLPNIYDAIFYDTYEYYDFHIESLEELLYQIYRQTYGFVYIFSLLLVLLPFQLIKDSHYRKGKRGIALWKKCLILSGIIVLVFLLIFRGPITEMKERVILFGSMLAIGTTVAILLYLLIDRYVERPRNKEN